MLKLQTVSVFLLVIGTAFTFSWGKGVRGLHLWTVVQTA